MKKITIPSVIMFQNMHNHLCPSDLDDVMEFLEDTKLLNARGKKFRSEFWKTFIKQ